MHAIQLLEIGKCFAIGCSTLTTLRARPSDQACQDYWLANRFRHESWINYIRQHQERISRADVQQRVQLWHEIVPLLQEILLTEPLARTVAYYSKLSEERGVESELSFAAQSAFSSHQEARMRCLNLMVFGYGIPAELVRQLNHVRLASENYNDQVLSLMPSGLSNTSSARKNWSFQPANTDRLGRTRQSSQENTPAGQALNQIRSQWISNWFLRTCALELDYRGWSVEQNRNISEAILAMLGQESFDSFGVLRSANFARLTHPSSEQAPIDGTPPTAPTLSWQFDTVSNDATNSSTTPQEVKQQPTSPLDILSPTDCPSENLSSPHFSSITSRIGRR